MKIKKHREKSRLIVYQGDELLVLQKLSDTLEYGLIGGYLKKEESPESGLLRETYEEVSVKLSEKDLMYYCSITLGLKNQPKLTKHYFICNQPDQPFTLAEPHKFRKIEWVHWKDATEFLGKSDRKVIKSLFEPCLLKD